MKSFDFGYKSGYYLGVVLIYGLYLLGIVAFVIDIFNHQIPIGPLAYLFVLGIWRKLMQIEIGLRLDGEIADKIATLNKLIASEKAINNANSRKFGGPN